MTVGLCLGAVRSHVGADRNPPVFPGCGVSLSGPHCPHTAECGCLYCPAPDLQVCTCLVFLSTTPQTQTPSAQPSLPSCSICLQHLGMSGPSGSPASCFPHPLPPPPPPRLKGALITPTIRTLLEKAAEAWGGHVCWGPEPGWSL